MLGHDGQSQGERREDEGEDKAAQERWFGDCVVGVSLLSVVAADLRGREKMSARSNGGHKLISYLET